MISYILVDDHPIVRAGISSVLSVNKDLRCLGEAADGEKALQLLESLSPDVIVMDIHMPNMNGIELLKKIKVSGLKSKVIALTMHDNIEYVKEVLNAGGNGFVLKDADPSELANIIRKVFAGEVYLSPSLVNVLFKAETNLQNNRSLEFSNLTVREKEVMSYIAKGLRNKEIATKLNLSIRTIETHRARLMRKLKVDSVAALTRISIESNE
jgi:DNA-binding NarL/FixJ family response regulator